MPQIQKKTVVIGSSRTQKGVKKREKKGKKKEKSKQTKRAKNEEEKSQQDTEDGTKYSYYLVWSY